MNQNDWQPIETAPRDGKIILAWIPFKTVICGDQVDGFAQTIEYRKRYNERGKWVNTWTGDGFYARQPTHWMPLPKGPE